MADESRASHNELTTEEPSSSSSELISDLEGDSTADVEDLLLARAAATGVGIDDGSEDLDEDDDDDMTYMPDDIEFEVEVEEEDQEDDTNEDEEEDDDDPEGTARQHQVLMRILQHSNFRDVLRHFASNGTIEIVDDDDETGNLRWMRQRRRRPDPNRFPKVPSDQGRELMNSGIFGSNDTTASGETGNDCIKLKKRLAKRILDRELAREGEGRRKENQRLMAQDMIPASTSDMIIHYDEPVYSGQFSDDGNFFFSANKDYKVRMYDTSNPYKWRYYKTVEYPFGQWTLTDASLSPDNKYLAYTSIRSTVCLAPTDPNDMGDPYSLDLAATGRNRENHMSPLQARYGGSFGIWSIRFSGDGKQLVAGATGGSIVVYDIESRQSLHRIYGHDADVNAVCFGDKASPHILYSGSDDTTLKVWDTRSMGESRAAGAFIGHIEGLTYIDSKGDGRYILSNGKDQTMRLWDLRMVMNSRDFEAIKPTRRATNSQRFDYRWEEYDEDDWYPDPHDNSVVAFRGHKVLRTLIRCHFSPPGSTNSRYVYSGSEDGKVYVYNMDATLAGKIDVYGATKNSRPYQGYHGLDWDDGRGDRWRTCVRDASWHPSAPMIVASAFNGYGSGTGTCTVHSWNDGAEEDEGEPKMGLRVGPQLEHDPLLYERRARSRPSSSARARVLRRMLQRMDDDEDDEEYVE